MNKFEAINKVLSSDLAPENKPLLIELIMRADDEWKCFPSVERLCKVRGIKHYKNFKGADHYLPGLVTKEKRGRKNFYTINTPALEGLSEADVVSRYNDSPAVEGVIDPSGEGLSEANTPAVADNSPAVEGLNSTTNTTEEDSTRESTETVSDEPVSSLNSKVKEVSESLNSKETSELSKVLEWNKEHHPSLTNDWEAVEKFYYDPEYLPNEDNAGKRLRAAVKRVAELEWASW